MSKGRFSNVAVHLWFCLRYENKPIQTYRKFQLQFCMRHENLPIQMYRKFQFQKLKKDRSDKKKTLICFFHISAQNIDYGYSLEPPRRGGSDG